MIQAMYYTRTALHNNQRTGCFVHAKLQLSLQVKNSLQFGVKITHKKGESGIIKSGGGWLLLRASFWIEPAVFVCACSSSFSLFLKNSQLCEKEGEVHSKCGAFVVRQFITGSYQWGRW